MRTLGRLLRGVVVALVTVLGFGTTAALADAGPPPFDPGEGWSLAGSQEDTRAGEASGCRDGDEWRWLSEGEELTLYVSTCDSEAAASGLWEWLAIPGDLVPNATVESEMVLWDGQWLSRGWVGEDAGYPLAVLRYSCDADPTACVDASADLTLAAMESLPGGADGASTPGLTGQAVLVNFVLAGAVVLLVLVPWRLIKAAVRSRYRSASTSPRYRDVTGSVRVSRWRRTGRRVLWAILILMLAVGIIALSTRNDSQIQGSVMVALGFAAVLAIGYLTFLKRHPVERGVRSVAGVGLESALGGLLSVLAVAMAALVLLVFTLVTNYGPMAEGFPSTTPADLARMDLPFLAAVHGPVTSLGTLTVMVTVPFLLAGFAASAAVDALGQRLRTASVDEALAQDNRPHYLYLRSFDEDRLRLPALLRSRGVLAAVSVMRKVRFEEVLVRQLSRTGPVIAIAPPGTNMPPIGAARASFSNDEWQQHVIRYAETARAVVLSATPGEIRQGYGWELDLIANRIQHQRVMVLLGPWPVAQLRRRWTQFCMAVSQVPFFAPITMPWVPDGVHVLAHSPQQGWQAWGATRRLDWTYAVAIDQATRQYLPDWS